MAEQSNKREESLVLNSALTPEERKERARKAGRASGAARRARKTLREELLALLSDGDTQARISLAMIAKAEGGSERAFEVIRDTIGEKPSEELKLAGGVKFTFSGTGEEDFSG